LQVENNCLCYISGIYPIQLAQFIFNEIPLEQHTFGTTHKVCNQYQTVA